MEDFSILIQKWYHENARDLPWRHENDPYKIWLSEIILQQTRVEQGLSYFLKLVKNYPTVKDLALATEDQVLNDWQGLGYYSRARNLHATSKIIHFQLKGEFPKDYKSVLALKGIGEYTAAAICSFAYQLPHAVVDGNVYRVLSRLLNIEVPIDSAQGKKMFKLAAAELLDHEHPDIHNQAIMELGALVCTPQKPSCLSCPVREKCLSKAANNQLNLPVKEKKIKVRHRYFHYFIPEKGDILLKKRGKNDIWQGLYDFPCLEYDADNEINQTDVQEMGFKILNLEAKLKHLLTHQRITATFWKVSRNDLSRNDGYNPVNIKDIEGYPMPQLLIRYLEKSDLFNVD